MNMSASIHCTAWRSASRRPKVERCLAYEVAISMHRSATPSARAPCLTRPILSHCWPKRMPSPSAPTRWLAGTRTSSSTISPRLVAHHGFVAGAELHAGRIHVDDEAGNAAARALRAVGRDHELHEIGVAGTGDEALDAVDQVVIAVAHGGGAHAAGIGPGVGLGLREAGLLLSAQQRQQVFLLHLALQRVENAARGWTGNALAARRDGDGARELFPHHGAREGRHAAAAIVRRHVELPDAELLGASLEAFEILRLEFFAGGGLALDRDQLIVDETPQRGFEDSQLFRQFEIHCPYVASPSSRHKTRTSTATTLGSAPAGFCAFDGGSRAGL